MKFEGDNKRDFYRVRYPIACRPVMTVGSDRYRVVDLSESGLKVLFEKAQEFEPGVVIHGEITFFDMETFPVEGEVLRINKKYGVAILGLKRSIPMGRIINEQRMIVEKYPDYLKG